MFIRVKENITFFLLLTYFSSKNFIFESNEITKQSLLVVTNF